MEHEEGPVKERRYVKVENPWIMQDNLYLYNKGAIAIHYRKSYTRQSGTLGVPPCGPWKSRAASVCGAMSMEVSQEESEMVIRLNVGGHPSLDWCWSGSLILIASHHVQHTRLGDYTFRNILSKVLNCQSDFWLQVLRESGIRKFQRQMAYSLRYAVFNW